MRYYPSRETMDVLRQAGYDEKTLAIAIEEFSEITQQYPDLIKPSDKEFYSHLTIKNIKLSAEVTKRFDTGTSWRPGVEEIAKLELEGYWVELIYEVLGDFLFRPQKNGVVISKFALFRAFLRERYPLYVFDAQKWSPDKTLLKLIELRLFVKDKELEEILPPFRQSAAKKAVPGKCIPRYFFNYVKYNKEKLRASYTTKRNWAY